MLTSIAIILLFGVLVGWIFSKMKLPSLLGMIILGIVLSPHCLNLVDDSILTISGDLRQIALGQHRINAKNRIIQWVPNKNCG